MEERGRREGGGAPGLGERSHGTSTSGASRLRHATKMAHSTTGCSAHTVSTSVVPCEVSDDTQHTHTRHLLSLGTVVAITIVTTVNTSIATLKHIINALIWNRCDLSRATTTFVTNNNKKKPMVSQTLSTHPLFNPFLLAL